MKKQYIDIKNIEKNPVLFLKIYKAYTSAILNINPQTKLSEFEYEPQDMANKVLKDAKRGYEYAQFLVKPENAILLVCRKENLTRRQLAELLGVRVSRLENCLSRDTVSKGIMTLLKERFNYL